ncbi:MAG: amino acid adenylation domain-containing protein, partial [Pseudonocardia sp.]|nr:amino acid adenylation domain-containing protein [Pseudonocardia sp.]
PSERRLLLEEWNRTERAYPSERCVHQLFEEQVRREPAAVAVEHDGALLSYGELNARANRLAHRLIQLGVGPDTLVAICVERSAVMVVGLLAILKAGGAYVPLDPGYPPERLAWLLGDAAPALVLADAAGRDALGADALSDRAVLDLDDLPQDTSDADPAVSGLTSKNLAYVIYTSGSTGQPKGVMVEHRSVARLLEATHDWFGFDESDVWSLSHSFAFDFSVWELWGALRYGGRLVIVPRDVARSADAFHELVCKAGVTVLNQTPSAFRTFIEADRRSDLRHRLRYVIFGGEALEPAMLRPWYERHAEAAPQLVNMYGITETTVHVTYRPLGLADTQAPGSPIGQRIPDLRIYVVDSNGAPAPIGVVGEMWVGGAGVARGYLNRPDLTAERFVPDRFGPDPDARLYRTGDLARWLPDGSLEFLGRNDEQVKIRGFRIEPGEIAARLAEHPAVQDAVVIAMGEGTDKRLVAYVVPEDAEQTATDASSLAGALRDHLGATLPDYMVPSAYVRIDALPLTPNGKLDRKALPAPDADALAHAAYEPPQGETETALAAIWSELLGIDRISRNDSFFALG